MWLTSLRDSKRQNEGIVTRHQFLMEHAGRARIMRRLTDQIEPLLCDQNDVIYNNKMGEKGLLVFTQEFSPESYFQEFSVVALIENM